MHQRLSCPLISERDLMAAERLLVGLAVGTDTALVEIQEAIDLMKSRVQPDADCCLATSVVEGPPEVLLFATHP